MVRGLEFEPTQDLPIQLNQIITPYREIKSWGDFLREYPFRFVFRNQVVEGGMQINIGDAFATDDAPSIHPYPNSHSHFEEYIIGLDDIKSLDLRREKIEKARQQETDIAWSNVRALRELHTKMVSSPMNFSVCLFDNALRGFSDLEQELLRQIRLVVIFGDGAKVRDVMGNIFFLVI